MFLELRDVHVHYGKIEAVKGVSLELGKGEIITLIGANGAGKTTILKTISGLVRSSAGQISYDGQRIDRIASSEVVAKGIAHVPEGRRLFKLMTVEENLVMGAYRVRDVIARNWMRSTSTFRSCATSAANSPNSSAVASSRWWRSAGR